MGRTLAMILVGIAIAVGGVAASRTPDPPKPDERLKGEFKRPPADGWTYVHLEGTPKEIRFQHGYCCRAKSRICKKFSHWSSGMTMVRTGIFSGKQLQCWRLFANGGAAVLRPYLRHPMTRPCPPRSERVSGATSTILVKTLAGERLYRAAEIPALVVDVDGGHVITGKRHIFVAAHLNDKPFAGHNLIEMLAVLQGDGYDLVAHPGFPLAFEMIREFAGDGNQ